MTEWINIFHVFYICCLRVSRAVSRSVVVRGLFRVLLLSACCFAFFCVRRLVFAFVFIIFGYIQYDFNKIHILCNGSNTSYICNYVQILVYTDPMQIVYLCPDIGIRWPNVSVIPDWINQLDSMLFGQSYSRIAKAGANHIHSRSELINYSFKSATLTSADVECKGRQTNV